MELYWGRVTLDKSTKTIDYKGKTIVCDHYTYSDGVYSMTCTLDPKTKISYEYTYSDETNYYALILKDTNLDLSLRQEEQKVVSGSFILYDYSERLPSSTHTLKGELEYKMKEYDPKTDLGTKVISLDIGIHEVVKVDLTEITPEGEVVISIYNKPQTKDVFLGDILFDSYIRAEEGWDYVITYGDKHTDTIDTVYGKRHVTVQSFEASNPDYGTKFEHTLTYGDKGMIYSREMYGDNGNTIKTCTWSYIGSSLKI